ncbi:MAG: TetR/AcrR family transcriptional regulator, partial [Desulfosporosinus sp.]|nr:TetR/AcrR family transcriptional regulator [Desulfosporosinus sp.]
LYKNRKIILMHLKNEEENANFEAELFKLPNEFKKHLCSYFEEMRNRGAISENPDTLAASFLATNFGLFLTSLVMNELTFETDIQTCITNHVKIFTKGIASYK